METLISEYKKKLLVELLDNMDEGSSDIQEERLDILDNLCDYLDDEAILFRVTEDFLLYGPTFGEYYDIIIPHFKSEEVLARFYEHVEDGWDRWKEDYFLLLNAIEAEKTCGFHVKRGILKSVYRDDEIISVPDTLRISR